MVVVCKFRFDCGGESLKDEYNIFHIIKKIIFHYFFGPLLGRRLPG